MKRLVLAMSMMLSVLVVQPAEASPPEFAVTDCPGMSDSVLRLYTAGLGREAEQGGYDFWFEQYQAGNWSLQRAAEHFVVSDEFVASYGSLDDLAFVQQLYRNVLGRDGEPDGVAFWTEQLESGARSRAIVLLNFSESPENVELSGTAPPSLGFFNGGLDTPWTCYQQPAAGTCNVGAWPPGLPIDTVPLWDLTIEVPSDLAESDVRARFEILRNATPVGTGSLAFDNVQPGERMRGLAPIGFDFIDDVPIDELTCRITVLEGRSLERSGIMGDPETTSCEAEPTQATDQSIGWFVGRSTTVVNTTESVASGSATVILRVDGFRVAQYTARFFDIAPGSTVEQNIGLFGDLVADAIPVGIDPRRVTCEATDLYWFTN